MILSSLVFDVLLFGLMAAAVAIDGLAPVTHGAATLVVLGFILFLAAEDAAHEVRRIGWSQESYASGIAVSAYGFIYFWWRNQSDAAATALHICLMLSALMILIGVVAAFGAAWKEKSARPIIGLVVTKIAALVLGIAAGWGILFWTSGAALGLKLAVVAVSLVAWRLRLKMKPVAERESTVETEAVSVTTAAMHPAAPRIAAPRAGTALDRALPLVVLGALGALIAR